MDLGTERRRSDRGCFGGFGGFSFIFFWIEQVPNDLTSSDSMAGRAGDCFGGMEIVMTWTLIEGQDEQE